MIGLTSFEVASNSAISLFANMNSNFLMEIGPNQDNCDINLVTVSYLILSVYPGCGACYAYALLFNGKCVDSCPVGYYALSGKCEPKVCQQGFYLNGNNCVKCPRFSNIK